MLARLQSLIPRPVEPTFMKLARESDAVLGNFMRGQISVMLVLGMVYALGLWIVGVEFGFLIGFIAGLVSFVPYLGAFVGISAAGDCGPCKAWIRCIWVWSLRSS